MPGILANKLAMGLDAVSIIMEAEERFGVTIEDREAERLRTPGMLVDLILARGVAVGCPVCRSQRGFALARKFLIEESLMARNEIGLEAPWRKLVEPADEKALWLRLRDRLGAGRWPRLEFPHEGAVIIVGSLSVAVPAGMYIGRVMGDAAAGGTCGMGAFFAAAFVLARFLKPLRNRIPSQVRKVRDLALVVAAAVPEGRWIRSEVSEGVRQIVTEVLGLKAGAYREDADFVKELGLQ